MNYLSPWVSGTIQLEQVYVHPWGPWWKTSLGWGCCFISSGLWLLTVLLRITFLPPVHSSCYPCILWRVGNMRWSRGWIVASKYLSRYILQFRYNSSILKSLVWTWEWHGLIETSLWFLAFSWFLISLGICQGAPFYNNKEHCNSIILTVVGILGLVGPQILLCISGEIVYDPQCYHRGYEDLLNNKCLFFSIIFCHCINCFSVS